MGNTVSYLGRTFSDQTYTSIGHVISGDSGSPVFYSHALYGVVTASSGSGHSYFTPFDNIAAEFSVSSGLSSSC